MDNNSSSINPMKEIKIGKVVVNISVGQSGTPLNNAMEILEKLTGQRPAPRRAKQTVRGFGIRIREPIACIVTLRRERAKEFLRKALRAVGNRINPKSFDRTGNFAFGIKEHIDLPGTRYDPDLGIVGMDVIVNLERPGYRVKKKKHGRSKIGSNHKITPNEAIEFMEENFDVEVETLSE
jgi:large subunit ribosomal protein L5